MPRVPSSNGPQLRDAPLQTPYGSAPDNSSQRALGAGLNAAGEAIDRIALQQDSEAAFRTETDIKAKWLEADTDLRKRYRGANAAGYAQEAESWWSKAQETATTALNHRAKILVGRSLGTARLQALSGAKNYVSAETERAQDEAFGASKTVEMQRALTDGRPEAIEAARVQLMQRNAQQGAIRGWDTNQVQLANLRDLTTLHSEHISRLAPTNSVEAQTYFDRFREEIDGTRHDLIGKVLKAEGDNQFAKQKAAEWATLPFDQQLVKAAEITDPARREKTLLTLKQNHGLVREAQEDQQRQFSDAAWQMVGKSQRVPEAVLASMDGRERVQLQDFLRQRAEHAADRGNKPVKTDPKAHAELWEQLVHDPDAFKTNRLQAYAMRLSQTDLEQLYREQQKLINPKTARDAVTLTQQMKATMDALKIKKPEAKGQFLSFVQAAVDDATTAKGKSLTYDERQTIIDRAVLQGPDPDAWDITPTILVGEKRMYELTPEQRSRFKPNAPADAPAAELDALNDALKAQGLALTPANRLALYHRVTKAAQ